MPKVEEVNIDEIAPNNPDIKALIKLIATDKLLAVAEGKNNGVPFVIISGQDSDSHFTFTQTSDGYKFTRDPKKTKV